jgi:hypothetical protein
MTRHYPDSENDKKEDICSYFEYASPDNIYSFCKYATLWIDGQGERNCPYEACPFVRQYSPVLKGVYCLRR